MFHRTRDASKVALVHLVARLRAGGFRLLDTQYVTDHLKIFGAFEVPRRQYHKLLESALSGDGDFAALGTRQPVTGAQALAQLAGR
jgi:leucyl/phenylalanyl-tRNA--protein transferase